MESAGFRLDGESDLLRHPADDHTIRVQETGIRGKTDQFVQRFRKPKVYEPAVIPAKAGIHEPGVICTAVTVFMDSGSSPG